MLWVVSFSLKRPFGPRRGIESRLRPDGVHATPRRRRAAQVLEKNTYVESGQKLIKLGDKSVAWDDSFRLFFTTKLGNPHYSPEVMAKTMLINYSVTQVRISAFRGVAGPSRHRRASFPGEEVVGGFLLDFGAVRTDVVAAMASS